MGSSSRSASSSVTRARSYVVGCLLLAVAVWPSAACADGERTATLQRAVSNTIMGPLDVALSPVVTAQTLYAKGKAENYSWPSIIALELVCGPGAFFPANAAAGFFRTWVGVMEIPVGLGLLVSKSFTNWEPPAFFELRDEPAMVNLANPVIPITFGVQYLG